MPKDKDPAQVEVDGDDVVTMTVYGLTIELPARVEEWDIDAVEAFELGRAVHAIRLIVGEQQYDKLRRAVAAEKGRRMRLGDLEPIAERVAELYGFDSAGK